VRTEFWVEYPTQHEIGPMVRIKVGLTGGNGVIRLPERLVPNATWAGPQIETDS
jgi:hypothetical protein